MRTLAYILAAAFIAVAVPDAVLAAEPDLPPPESAKPEHSKLDSQLNRMVAQIGQVAPSAIAYDAPLYQGSSVAVTVRLSSNASTVADFLDSGGAIVANVGADYVEAYVPIALLVPLSELEGVLWVQTIIPPQPDVVSQGVALHGAPAWQARGFTGAGVKVGIIDGGFEGFGALMGSELPSTVVARCYTSIGVFTTSLSDCENGEVHGTAVAEAVADIAPDASLYIANAISAGDLQAIASWMVGQGVAFINMSLGWTWDGPGDGTSASSNSPKASVDAAVSGGAVWVNSAGNSAKDNWFGSYSDADVDGWIEFSPGIEVNTVDLASGESLTAQARWTTFGAARPATLTCTCSTVGLTWWHRA